MDVLRAIPPSPPLSAEPASLFVQRASATDRSSTTCCHQLLSPGKRRGERAECLLLMVMLVASGRHATEYNTSRHSCSLARSGVGLEFTCAEINSSIACALHLAAEGPRRDGCIRG